MELIITNCKILDKCIYKVLLNIHNAKKFELLKYFESNLFNMRVISIIICNPIDTLLIF